MTKLIQADQAGIPWLRRLADLQPKPVSYIPYDIPLRPGRAWAHLRLPADLTEHEAERLCGVLRAVAFPEEVSGA
jgi:hypothetical protein